MEHISPKPMMMFLVPFTRNAASRSLNNTFTNSDASEEKAAQIFFVTMPY
jgi:hypothetical protein